MKKSSSTFSSGQGAQTPRDPSERQAKPSKQELAAAWDATIRAFYLVHEMRHFCANANFPAAESTRIAALALEIWATSFGVELERVAGEKTDRN